MEELKFPVMYAVLELKEQGGYNSNYEDITRGFIASKCYVVGSEVKYFKNGNADIIYKVVFPYTDITCFKRCLKRDSTNLGDKNIPKFDACDKYWPVSIVSNLYNNYEDCKSYALEKNKLIKKDFIYRNSISNPEFKKGLESIEENINICNMFEDNLDLLTQDMNVTDNFDKPYILNRHL